MATTTIRVARLELWGIADRLDALSPLVSRDELRRSERNAFQLGRDHERGAADP
jgi:hypothetical protein